MRFAAKSISHHRTTVAAGQRRHVAPRPLEDHGATAYALHIHKGFRELPLPLRLLRGVKVGSKSKCPNHSPRPIIQHRRGLACASHLFPMRSTTAHTAAKVSASYLTKTCFAGSGYDARLLCNDSDLRAEGPPTTGSTAIQHTSCAPTAIPYPHPVWGSYLSPVARYGVRTVFSAGAQLEKGLSFLWPIEDIACPKTRQRRGVAR